MSLKYSRTTLFPPTVLENIHSRFLNFENSPFAFIETSHRSKGYAIVNESAMEEIKKFFKVSETHEVLMLPSATAIPSIYFNLLAGNAQIPVYVLNTGVMSELSYRQFVRSHELSSQVSLSQLQQLLISTEEVKPIVYYHMIDHGHKTDITDLQNKYGDRCVFVANANYLISPLEQHPKEEIICFDSEAGFSTPGFNVVLIKKYLLNQVVPVAHCPDMMCYPLTFKMKSIVNTPYTLCTLALEENIKYRMANYEQISQEVIRNKEVLIEYLVGLNISVAQCSAQNFISVDGKGLKEEMLGKIGFSDGDRIYFWIQNLNRNPAQALESLMSRE